MQKDKATKRRHRRKRKLIDWSTLIIGIVFCLFMLTTSYQELRRTLPKTGDISYSEFKEMVAKGEIDYVLMTENLQTMTVYTKDGNSYSTLNPDYDEYKKDLLDSGIDVRTRREDIQTAIISIVTTLPTILLLTLLIGWLAKTIGTTKSTSFQVLRGEIPVKFSDVAGMPGIKKEVQFAIETLRDAKQIKALGGRPIKGIILEGPPGTGKTLIAKAIAGEADVPFISASGSDFEEMFVGLGAARLRSLWYLAELNAPCVLFIDEIDAMGANRNRRGMEVYSQTLNALLSKMDGLIGTEGIMVIGATNRVDSLDPALLRSGRFDRMIHIGLPETKADRLDIMRVHLANKQIAPDFDIDKAATYTFGMSGADIENTLNEAIMCSLLADRKGIISLCDIEEASMKLSARGVVTDRASEDDRYRSAVHEAGHTLMHKLLGNEVAKVSIRSYTGGIGGVTVRDSEQLEGKKLRTKDELIGDIKVLLAGGAAEELILGSRSQGWSNDLMRVTELIKDMYYRWGMLGNYISSPDDIVFKDDKQSINNTICSYLQDTELEIRPYREWLLSLTDELMEKETLYKADIKKLTF